MKAEEKRKAANDLRKKFKKEIKYTEPEIPQNRCGNCKYSFCHNSGAYIPGISCKVISKHLKKFYPYDNALVDPLGHCNNYKLA